MKMVKLGIEAFLYIYKVLGILLYVSQGQIANTDVYS